VRAALRPGSDYFYPGRLPQARRPLCPLAYIDRSAALYNMGYDAASLGESTPGTSLPALSNNYATMPAETIYEGPAHDATFHVPSAGFVRLGFSDPRAQGFIRSPGGAMTRVQPGTRLFLSAGQHVLTLYDPNLAARVSIGFLPN